MKLTEVRRNAFAMPLNDPAYPPGPYKFYNRDFMLGPAWKEGCVGCSFGADHMGCLVHLEHERLPRLVHPRGIGEGRDLLQLSND